MSEENKSSLPFAGPDADAQNTEPASLIDALARRIHAETGDDPDLEEGRTCAEAAGPGFQSLGLNTMLCKALADAGYSEPTGVQVQAIPAALDGADLRVASSTGSGKTAAFMLPSLQRIIAARGDNTKRREKGKVQGPRVLVLAPTRELAIQVAKAATTYGRHVQGLRVATVVGGVPYAAQLKALRGPLDVLIATPGRLLDHLGTGAAVLANLEVLVLDEADRMLDMGFIDDIEAIAEQTPANRQTLMFSATFAGHVGQLAQRLTRDAVHIEVASHTDSHDNIEQRLHLADSLAHKNDLLDHLLTAREVDQAVIFTSTQRDADILADRLADIGHAVAALHGGMPQGRRNRVLQAMRMRQLRVLVATDVAARGIDVPTITHVINYGMPMKPEDYVHRIGRTGRAGRSGLAVTLCERRDIPMMRRIERFTTQRIPEAVIAGLEPKMKSEAPRGRGPHRDKPMPGHRHRDEQGGGARFGGKREGGFHAEGRGERSPFNKDAGKGMDRPAKDWTSFADRERPVRQATSFGDRPSNERGPFANRADRGDRPFDRPAHRGADQGFDPRGGQGKPHHGGKAFKHGDDKRGFEGGAPGKSFGDKPFGKPAFGGDKPAGGKSFSGKPFAGKSFGGKPSFKSGGKPGQGGGKRTGFGKREG